MKFGTNAGPAEGDSGFFIDLGKGGGLGYRFERRKSVAPTARTTFEGVVVDVHEMRRGRELAAVVRIVNDKVGVAAGLYCAFSWKKLEDLCPSSIRQEPGFRS